MASPMDLTALEKDPRLFLYTSLTAGSSHIITATSRMETILKANKIPFQAIDIATDEKARRLWQRRAGKRKIPGLVKEGYVVGDLNEVEEWNEFGELRENIGPVPAHYHAPPGGQVGVQIAPPLSHNVAPAATSSSKPALANKAPQQTADRSRGFALPGAAEIAARNNKSSTTPGVAKADTRSSTTQEVEAKTTKPKQEPKSLPAVEHLSAPASRIPSGTATPVPSEGEASEAPAKVTQQSDEQAQVDTGKEKQQDSEIVEAPTEETKKVQSQNEDIEITGDGKGDAKDSTAEATAAVEALKVDELADPPADGEKAK